MDRNHHQQGSRASIPSRPSPWNHNSPLAPNESPVAAPSSYVPIPDRGHGNTTRAGRMDPFEVRIRFTGLLQHLNASLTSANKAAQYALRYRDMDEDLHSCILEQLEKVCIPDFFLVFTSFFFTGDCEI
jgi:CTD kinase subunit gamma